MFKSKSKKGISEIISVTLLIVIVVILASLFFAWSKNSTKNRMDEISAELKAASDLDCSKVDLRVDSVTFDDYTKNLEILFRNNSDLKIFNLVLTIEWENNSGEQVSIAGRFEEIIPKGETRKLYTGTNFTFTRGSQSLLNDLNIDSISNIALTNGTCPKDAILINTYGITYTVSTPFAEPEPQTYFISKDINLSTATEGATIYYTIDGNTPSFNSLTYSGAINIPLDTTVTIKAIAVKSGMADSNIFSGTYIVTHNLTAPTPDYSAGTYFVESKDIVLSADEGNIYYTTNGDTPTINSTKFSEAIYLGMGVTTIKAIAIKDGYGDSSVFSGDYNIAGVQVATPDANLPDGSYSSAQSVTLSCSTNDADIYYTTNGDTPTTSSTLYTDAISISSTTTLKARAFKTDWTDSNVMTKTYTILIQYNTGALSPGTMVDDATIGTEAWANPDNAKISDNSYSDATIGNRVHSTIFTGYTTHYLKATNFDFNIPTGATIDGIKVEIEKNTNGPSASWVLKIVKADGSIGSTNMASGTWPTPSDPNTYETYGGASNLWGETWAAENINDSNFGIVLSITGFTSGGMYQCLNENTLISTDYGYKKIKELNIGENVFSYNEITKKLEFKPITNIWSNPISIANNRYFYIYYNNGEVIKATENHRFYVSGEYKRADELHIGDVLLSSDLQEQPIENIEIVENTTDYVWDIEVEDNHNFFANDVLVHNACPPDCTTTYYAHVDHIRMTVYYTN